MDDAAVYNGKTVDLRQKMTEVVDGLSECTAFTSVISIPRFSQPRDISSVPKAETLASLLSSTNKPPPEFVRIAFHEPSLICFSSGTTGMPKAITHSVGGLMLSYAKEGRLHEDLGPTDTGLQYTTTGWIMYVANAALLLFGSRSVFYVRFVYPRIGRYLCASQRNASLCSSYEDLTSSRMAVLSSRT